MSRNIAIQVTGGRSDIGLDWTDALAEIGSDETIVDSAWEKLFGSIEFNDTTGLVGELPGHTFDETSTLAWFQGGQEGTTSKVKNTVTTSGGRKLADEITVKVLDHLNPQISIPDNRIFRLVPTPDSGLLGEVAKSFSVDIPTTFAVDFGADLPLYGRILTVVAEITVGDGGGLNFGAATGDRTKAKIRFTPLTAGAYTVRIGVTYDTLEGAEDEAQGDIIINVVA